MFSRISHPTLLLAFGVTVACDPAPPAPLRPTDPQPSDPIDAPLWSKADGGCPAPDTAAAAGILDLVNDPATTQELLDRPHRDGGVGLDRRAAEGIVEERPFASLSQLDAVPYVGPTACRALADHACNHQRRCIEPLRVATWNVEHFPLTPNALSVVPEVIVDLELDVVAVQEIEDVEAFDTLMEALPAYSGYLAESGPFMRVGMIVRDDAVELHDVRSEFVDDGWAFPRPPLVLRTQVRGALSKDPLTFVALHLKARIDETSRSRREDAVEKLRDYIDARREAGPQAMVLLGDWNDSLTDPPQWNVFGPLLDEAADTSFLTLPAAEEGIETLIPFSSTIDHVMVTDEVFDDIASAQQTEVLQLDATMPGYADEISDHRPVLTTFAVPRSFP